MHRYRPLPEGARLPLILAAFGYLLFVIYGSLVPLEYRAMPFDEALQKFWNIRYQIVDRGSRADWATNVLLIIPLAFLWLGVFWPRYRGFGRPLISLLVFIALLIVSLTIEFVQLYFPPRSLSIKDILAQMIGTLIGIILWWKYGVRLHNWLREAWTARGQTQLAEKLLWIYLAGLFFYNVLPLDLTISPVEIYHKWRSGKVNLIPFGFDVTDTAQYVYNLVTDALIWVPVSLLWVVSGKRRGMQAWAWTVLAAIVLEFAQFFVFSRVSDVTDILTAMLGAGFGIWLARFFTGREHVTTPGSSGLRRPAWAIVTALAWTLILILIFWYPFDFQLDRTFLRERLQLFERIPLHAYFYGTEFRAVTELLHKILFLIPLGAILAFGRLKMRRSAARTIYGLLSISLLLAVPFGIELGQIALPNKSPSTTDLVLEVIGGFIGYFGLLFLKKRSRVDPDFYAQDRGNPTRL